MNKPIDPNTSDAHTIVEMFQFLGQKVGEVNVANGWDTSRAMIANPDAYDPRWQVSHKIAELGLIATEVAEAIEEVRHGHAMNEVRYSIDGAPAARRNVLPAFHDPLVDFVKLDGSGENSPIAKPEGVPSELADIVIRVLDLADAYGIDLGAAVIEKLNHNATRGMHHGGKAL